MTDKVYAKIEDAITNKKRILESTTDTIEILKQFEEFKKIRGEKGKTQQKFIDTIKKISNLITKLKTNDLPEIEIEEGVPKGVVIAREVKIVKTREEKKKPTKELIVTEQLDKELRDIQNKINNLEI